MMLPFQMRVAEGLGAAAPDPGRRPERGRGQRLAGLAAAGRPGGHDHGRASGRERARAGRARDRARRAGADHARAAGLAGGVLSGVADRRRTPTSRRPAPCLAADRLWNAYSLADLEPPWRTYARVARSPSRRAGRPGRALTLFRHPSFTSIIPHGHADGPGRPAGRPARRRARARPRPRGGRAGRAVERRRPAASRPSCSRAPSTSTRCGARYDLPDPHPMLRMAVDAASFRAPPGPLPAVERLGVADEAGAARPLRRLRRPAPSCPTCSPTASSTACAPAAGSSRRPARTWSAAGAASPRSATSSPAPRRAGAAARWRSAPRSWPSCWPAPAATSSLNVAATNEPAQRVYRRLGFREHCPYFEGVATARASP